MRWRQFHLSTAVLLMLTAAVLLWLNFRPDFAWDWAIVTAKQVRPLPEIEFVDFRLGGTFAIRYGWPLTARCRSWDVAPMLVVQPAEIPLEWRQQALRERAADLTFVLPSSEMFDRVLPGERVRPLRPESAASFVYTGAGFDTELVWKVGGILANVLVAVGILLAIGIGAEWRLWRKDRIHATPGR